jgi:hypothetical protein
MAHDSIPGLVIHFVGSTNQIVAATDLIFDSSERMEGGSRRIGPYSKSDECLP